MAIVYRGREWYGNTSSDTATVAKPTGTVDGDLLIAFVLAEDVSTLTADTGTWTEFAVSVGANSFETAAFWRIADSEPSEWVFSSTQSADDLEVCVMVFYNTSGVGTWAKEDEDYEFVDQVHPQGTVTIDVTSGELLVCGMGCDDNWLLDPDPADQGMTRTFYAGVSGEGGEFTTSGISMGVFYQLDASGSTSKNWGFPDTSTEEGDCKAGVFSWTSVTAYKLEGISKDKNGDALGSCLCFLCKDNGDNTATYVDYVLSNASTGAYSFTGISDDDAQYFVISWKDDTPHIFDVTDHVLQPVEE